MSNIFFTSDTHFNHENILSYCSSTRPWNTVKEMNEALVDAWNSVVKGGDIVYHLGDFILGKPDFYIMGEILGKLQGQIKLIPGNHDTQNKLSQFSSYHNIEVLNNIHEIKKPKNIVLCHYPLEVWHHNHKGAWHLHGHCHGYLDSNGYRMDVGVDTNPKHRPYSYDEVDAYLDYVRQVEHFKLPTHHSNEPLHGD